MTIWFFKMNFYFKIFFDNSQKKKLFTDIDYYVKLKNKLGPLRKNIKILGTLIF